MCTTPRKLRALDAEAVKLLATPHGGVTLVTLAPECTTPAFIRALSDAGVIVSAGHTNATYDELQPAFAAGLRGFTHLFNAMSPMTSREPGAVGAALAHADSWVGLIVDGHHVHPEVMKSHCARSGATASCWCAMPCRVWAHEQGIPLQGRPITVEGNRIVDDEGRLAGAHLDMASAVRNTVEMLGLELSVGSAYGQRLIPRNFWPCTTWDGLQPASAPISSGWTATCRPSKHGSTEARPSLITPRPPGTGLQKTAARHTSYPMNCVVGTEIGEGAIHELQQGVSHCRSVPYRLAHSMCIRTADRFRYRGVYNGYFRGSCRATDGRQPEREEAGVEPCPTEAEVAAAVEKKYRTPRRTGSS